MNLHKIQAPSFARLQAFSQHPINSQMAKDTVYDSLDNYGMDYFDQAPAKKAIDFLTGIMKKEPFKHHLNELVRK